MSWLLNCILSQNTIIWRPSLAPKSTRRSPRSRINSTSSSSTKTWRVWDNTHNSNARPLIKRASLSIHHLGPMGHYYDRVNLPPAGRPKITNCLLVCKSHGIGGGRDPNPDPMGVFRGNYLNNCPRPSILNTILPSQHSIRADPQSNNSSCPGTTSNLSINRSVMIYCQLS